MSKYIICADTHLDRKNSSPKEIEITKDFFDWVIDTAVEKNIKKFIHLGDWHNNRRFVSLPAIDLSNKIFMKLNKAFDKSYVILGNHDIHFKNLLQPNSLEWVNMQNVHIISKPSFIETDGILLIPWMVDNSCSDFIKNNSKNTKTLMGHLSINDITMNRSNVKSKNEMLNVSDFKKYDMVFSGHFHQKGVYQNITYLGAPYHMNFNDGGERGIYIYDSETSDIEFIEYKNAPKYVIMGADTIEWDSIKNNFVRIEFYENIGINKMNDIIRKIEKKSPEKLFPSYKFTKTNSADNSYETMEIKPNKEILLDYMQKNGIPKNLNLKTIDSIVSSLEKTPINK